MLAMQTIFYHEKLNCYIINLLTLSRLL